MYTSIRMGQFRHQDMLAQAQEMRQARYLRALSRASRRVERARKRLSQAQREARQLSGELGGSWG